MPLDNLPSRIVVFSRDEIVRRYLRDYQFRIPTADVGPDTLPFAEAQTFADQQIVLMANAEAAGAGGNVENLTGDKLKALGESEGVLLLPAVGGNGFVAAQTSAGGSTIFAGDVLTDPVTSLRFQCLVTGLYVTGGVPVPIGGIDTGDSTNLAAGTVLTWSNPRPGCGPSAAIVAQTDGSGLSGGHPAESEPEYIARILENRANPAASENAAAVIKEVERTPGIRVEKAFAVPAIKGPGTIGVLFTVPPDATGSRLPNDVEIAQVEANLKAIFSGDSGIFVCVLLAQSTSPVLRVTWAAAGAGWTDIAPWPAYNAGFNLSVDPGGAAPTPTTFRVTVFPMVLPADPVVGQTIGFYDTVNKVFRRKRILTATPVVAHQSWDVVCDASNGASDTSFTPAVFQYASPWSDSLNDLPALVAAGFGGLGPGEQVASFPDPGLRQRRWPFSPGAWPSVLLNKFVGPILALPSIDDAALAEPTVPHPTVVGAPGVLSKLQQLGDIGVYPQ